MANVYRDSIGDAEYVARVRRHSPSSLVPLIAQTSAQYWQPGSWLKSPYRKYTPWALADIARVSLTSGNEYRSAATQEDLLYCCAAYVAVSDAGLASNSPDSLTGFFLRITSEQGYNQTPYNEVGRTVALFENTQSSKPLKVIRPGWDTELFGCTLSQYTGAGFFVQATAAHNAGMFSADWFNHPQLDPITAVMPTEVLASAVAQNFVGSLKWFHAQRSVPMASDYRRFTFNPLLARPVVAGVSNELLVPSILLVLRKISPLGVYYAGAKKWGNSFTDDVGDLFEQYVGRQLATIPNAQIHPEIVYDKGGKRSVDWVVVCADAVILVEVKSVRPTEPVRMGTADAGAELRRMLGKAYKQVNTTDDRIAEQHPAFAHIPADLPRIGLIVTMERFDLANARPIQDLLDVTPKIPTTIAASEDIERLVTLQDIDVSAFLQKFLADPTMSDGSRISNALADKELGRNSVLDHAWDTYEWGPKMVLGQDLPDLQDGSGA
ncbi:hypothetical protein [Mycobacterium sp. 1081908.1]|uniref:hypothetical protein n=1 Tax=Mycobacterium sp. 1081908.1 TaxID=1834066 RepID=UPI000A953B64|nr:hypothetical protein [Mycobacterium sp. 1081908.1]